MAEYDYLTEVSADRVLEVLSYNPATGVFTWRVRTAYRTKIGDIAGSSDRLGYKRIAIDGNSYMAHRLAFLMMTGDWPDEFVDHADGNPANNSWGNLRLASRLENASNQRVRKNNTSGFKGVSPRKGRGTYQASIRQGTALTYLGTFAAPEDAARAYDAAAIRMFGEFATTNEAMGLLG